MDPPAVDRRQGHMKMSKESLIVREQSLKARQIKDGNGVRQEMGAQYRTPWLLLVRP